MLTRRARFSGMHEFAFHPLERGGGRASTALTEYTEYRQWFELSTTLHDRAEHHEERTSVGWGLVVANSFSIGSIVLGDSRSKGASER